MAFYPAFFPYILCFVVNKEEKYRIFGGFVILKMKI